MYIYIEPREELIWLTHTSIECGTLTVPANKVRVDNRTSGFVGGGAVNVVGRNVVAYRLGRIDGRRVAIRAAVTHLVRIRIAVRTNLIEFRFLVGIQYNSRLHQQYLPIVVVVQLVTTRRRWGVKHRAVWCSVVLSPHLRTMETHLVLNLLALLLGHPAEFYSCK